MSDRRIRRRIALRAAQMMYERQESEYFTAKRKAARELRIDPKYRPGDLPTNAEIRDEIQKLADLYEGDARLATLREMRLEALRWMRRLAAFRPKLIGSVFTGHVRTGSDIDVHVFADHQSAVTDVLDAEGAEYDVEHKRVLKHGEERRFTHIHLMGKHQVELTLYPTDKVNYPFKSSITGKPIEKASVAELEALLRTEDPNADLDAELERLEDHVDLIELYRLVLAPLENVKQDPRYHPEGDALFHSLQVFELARQERPYDEEFLLAALLHDIGKAIDPRDHVAAGLEALEGALSERTEFLIAHHMDALAIQRGELGARAKRRLRDSEWFEDLMLLRECDSRGRIPGGPAPSLDEALEYLAMLGDEG